VDFELTEEQKRLQQHCQELAADFATRSADHDRDATHPTENYRRLREEGFYELNIPKGLAPGAALSGWGARAASAAAGGFLPLEHEHVRAEP